MTTRPFSNMSRLQVIKLRKCKSQNLTLRNTLSRKEVALSNNRHSSTSPTRSCSRLAGCCDKYPLQPTLFYRWQKQFFEQGAAAFAAPARGNSVAAPLEQKMKRYKELSHEIIPIGPTYLRPQQVIEFLRSSIIAPLRQPRSTAVVGFNDTW